MALKIRISFFIIVTILISICMLYSSEKKLFKKLNIDYLTIYTNSDIKEYQTSISGNGYSFICSVGDFKKLNCEIDGISFETFLSPEEIFKRLKLEVQDQQKIDLENPIKIYYCYIKGIDKNVVVNNKKINIQIVYDGKKTILGIPLIPGSY